MDQSDGGLITDDNQTVLFGSSEQITLTMPPSGNQQQLSEKVI